MKKIIIGLLIAIPLLGKGQARLGYSIYEIKKDFPNNKFEYSANLTNKVYYLEWTEFASGIMFYAIDRETNICDECLLYPKNVGTMNALVEKYNNNYVIISSTEWNYYANNGEIIVIKLKHLDNIDHPNVFIFTYKN